MDLRSNATIERKKAEARAAREYAARQRELARTALAEPAIKQKEEEAMDVEADKTQAHGEELRDHDDASVSRIAAYHRHIDTCTKEMKDCETRIDEYRASVRRQHRGMWHLSIIGGVKNHSW